jgi:hypothetical protein
MNCDRQPESKPLSHASLVQLHNTLYKNALTEFGEHFSFSPESTLIVQIGSLPLCPLLQKLVQAYPTTSIATMRKTPRQEEIKGILHALGRKKKVLVILCDLERSAHLSFGLMPGVIHGLQEILKTGSDIRYVIFGSPYVLTLLPKPISSALIAYEKTKGSEKAVFQALCGTFTPTGQLPVHFG